MFWTFQAGQFQFCEPGGLVTASSMYVYDINPHGGSCTALDISSNCHAMVFGDSSGKIDRFNHIFFLVWNH
jgi:expansin (peptidoglycan-binding protein)